MIVCTGKRASASARAAIVAEIEATALHQVLMETGFQLRPFRLPSGLRAGDLRLRLVWQKKTGDETQTVRFTHTVAAPIRS